MQSAPGSPYRDKPELALALSPGPLPTPSIEPSRATSRAPVARLFSDTRSRTEPRRRPAGTTSRLRFGRVFAAACGALVFVALTDGGRTERVAAPLLPELETVLSFAGLGLDQVSVVGHRFTTDIDILDALDLPNARTWARFDSAAARMRIERLPWVASATLTRRYPGRLDVTVIERKATAVWQHGSRETLIDATGRSLSDVRPGTVTGLPRFLGDGADVEAADLAAVIARHPEIQSRLKVAERVAGRRWSLHLDNGTTLHLPPDREARILDGLVSRARLQRLVTEPNRVIDLRAPGRIAIRLQTVPSDPASRKSSLGPPRTVPHPAHAQSTAGRVAEAGEQR